MGRGAGEWAVASGEWGMEYRNEITSSAVESNDLQLIVCPHPLSTTRGRIDVLIPAGATVAEHLRAIGCELDRLNARVYIDGRLVPQAEWEWAVPRAGQLLALQAVPADGGDGGGGKSILGIVAMIGLIVATWYIGGGGALALMPSMVGGWTGAFAAGQIGATVLAGGVLIGGSLAINALIPPSRQLDDGMGAGAANPSYFLTGTKNQILPFGTLPQVLGRHRIYPPYAARPFTEVVGDQHFLRCLFTCGLGPLALSDFKIGETPLDNYQDVEIDIRYGYPNDTPIVGFPDDVYEDGLSIPMSGDWIQRTTQPNANEIALEWTFPDGLATFFKDIRDYISLTITLPVEYRLVGDVSWTVPDVVDLGATAFVETDFAGANNDIRFAADEVGSFGNAYYISMVQQAGMIGVSVSIAGGVMTIRYQAGTTAAQVITAVNNAVVVQVGNRDGTSQLTRLIWLTASNKSGNNGTGAVSNFSAYLTGGRNRNNPLDVTGRSRATFTKVFKFSVPVGQYEVRTRKQTGTLDPTMIHFHDCYFTMLRTIQDDPPTTLAGQCLVYLRIRATDQIHGKLESFNCIAQTIAKDWTGSEWLEQPTSNPASIYRLLLQGPANAKPKPDSRMDLTTLQAFHERCATNGFTFNAVIDQRTDVRQLRQDVLASGRGTFELRDMLYSVVEDLPQAIPAAVITPRNAWDLKGTKLFLDLPHARKIRFKNEEKNWDDDEMLLPLDGYGITGLDQVRRDAFGQPTTNPEATKFETADAGVGVTNPTQVFKLERYNQAVAVLRSEWWTVNQDFEQLRCQRGDLVHLNYDTLLVGLGRARIKAVAVDGSGNATSITIDDPLTMEAGKTYGARVRRSSDGAQVLGKLVTVVGAQTVLTFETAIPSATVPAVGDLAALGEYGLESMPCLVRTKTASQDLQATLTLVPYAPGVQTAADGVIPPFSSYLTLPSQLQQAPPTPIIESIRSDETVLVQGIDGTLMSRIVITLAFTSGYHVPASELLVQIRPIDSLEPWRQLRFAPDAVQISIGEVQDGLAYALQLRTVTMIGQTSDTVAIEHTVVGKTTPPPDVTGLTYTSDGIQWAYPEPPVDFDGFLIRVRPGLSVVWEDAFQLNAVPITSMSYPLVPDGSTRIIMVKAVDVSGMESAEPAWILQDAAALVLRNLAETIDEKALGFPGVKTNCTVVGGNLTADSQTLFWANDTALFWSADSALFWQGTYKDLTYVATITPPAQWGTGTLRVQLGITAQGWTIEYRPSSTTLFWSSDSALFWSSDAALFWGQTMPEFSTWPGALDLPKRQAYEFRITAVGGQIAGVISFFNVLFDMPDLREVLDRVSIPSGGGRLPLTKVFRVIKAVSPTIVGSDHQAVRVRTLDTQLSPGPLVQTFDQAGADVPGQIYAVVDGY